MRSLDNLKPQDVLILLKIFTWGDRPQWFNSELARELNLSPFEISVGLERCHRAGFLDAKKRKLKKSALLEFLIHGIKYVYSAKPGPICRGVPTAHSAPPLANHILASESDQYVWPSDDGKMRGQAISPLYESVPRAALKDSRLHELLALVDAIRVGRTREQKMASHELEKRMA